MGYKKLIVGDDVYLWNEGQGKLVKKLRDGGWDGRGRRAIGEGMGGKEDEILRVVVWNVRGLKGRESEVGQCVEGCDVVGLVETWTEARDWEEIKKKLPRGFRWRLEVAVR